ncbi:MAG: hypothetical protein V1909_04000, partial [Candidatus Micrarchaeota archaeon]
ELRTKTDSGGITTALGELQNLGPILNREEGLTPHLSDALRALLKLQGEGTAATGGDITFALGAVAFLTDQLLKATSGVCEIDAKFGVRVYYPGIGKRDFPSKNITEIKISGNGVSVYGPGRTPPTHYSNALVSVVRVSNADELTGVRANDGVSFKVGKMPVSLSSADEIPIITSAGKNQTLILLQSSEEASRYAKPNRPNPPTGSDFGNADVFFGGDP